MRFTYTHDWTVPATPDRVFRALTDADELRQWFAQDALVEPRMGGVYRFWGRNTLGTPAEDAARQVITRFEPGHALGFLWPINEVDTIVTMTLAPDDERTRLMLTHEVSDDLGVNRQGELVDELWRRAMGNLISHLAGAPVTMPDYFLNSG